MLVEVIDVMNSNRGVSVFLRYAISPRNAIVSCCLAALTLVGTTALLESDAQANGSNNRHPRQSVVAQQQPQAANSRSLFGKQEVVAEDFIAMAAPRGLSGDYYLMIVEQQTDARACWQERGTAPIEVDPLLLTFDFSSICGRKSDSNAYSIRMDDVDLGLNYSLRVVPEGNELLLRGYSNVDFTAPPIEIGRTYGVSSTGYTRIVLNPGWRLTRRVYGDRALGHIYLTNDLPLSRAQASSNHNRNHGRLASAAHWVNQEHNRSSNHAVR